MITSKSRIWHYVSNLFLAIDQLGNVIAGGNADNTISARIGFYNHHYFEDKNQVPRYWRLLEKIIDATFYPVDGPGHCHEAYHNDPSEIFDNRVTNFLVVLASIVLIIPSCLVIFIVLYTLTTLRIVKQQSIDRNKNIQERFEGCHKYLNGVSCEIEEHQEEIDFNRLNNLKSDLIQKIEEL